MSAREGRREPERTCVGCRRVRPKAALIRLARSADGAVVVDPAGTAPGRGAYVCRSRDCMERASRGLVRVLRAERIDLEQVRGDLTAVGAG